MDVTMVPADSEMVQIASEDVIGGVTKNLKVRSNERGLSRVRYSDISVSLGKFLCCLV